MNKSRGRRKGSPDTRGLVLEVARRRFLADGYARTTLRSIAAEAGVDVALLSYFYGSKRGLFSASMTLLGDPSGIVRDALAGDRRTLAPRLVGIVTTTWDDPEALASLKNVLAAALQDPELLPVLGEFLEHEVVAPVAQALGGGRRAQERALAVAAPLAGLVLLRHLLAIDPAPSLSPRRLQALLAPAVEAALRAR